MGVFDRSAAEPPQLADPAASRVAGLLLLPPMALPMPQVAADETDSDERQRFMEALRAGQSHGGSITALTDMMPYAST